MAEEKAHQPFGDNPEAFGYSDQLILVPTNPSLFASWGDTVHFYARLINLTTQELKTGGIGGGMSEVKHGKYVDLKSPFPATVPANSVSEPYHVMSVELNPDNFARMEFVLFGQVQLGYTDTAGKTYSGQPVYWRVQLSPTWVVKGNKT